MTPEPRQSRSPQLLWLLTVLLAVPQFASASVMNAVDFDTKVEKAESIVLGKCLSTRAQWSPDKKWIVTYATFSVEKTLKGNASGEMTLVLPGGSVGDVHQDTVGVPDFRQGSEHLVFVRRTSLGPSVLYFDQGAYDIQRDERGERMILPVSSDAVRIDTQRGVAVPAEQPRLLREFEGSVRDSIRRAEIHKMEMVKRQQGETTIWSAVERNKWLILLALAGVALATWQLLRR